MHAIAFELSRHLQGSGLGTQDLLKVCAGEDDWGWGRKGRQFFFGTIFFFGLLFLAGSLAILFIFVSSARKERKEEHGRELSSLPSSLFFLPLRAQHGVARNAPNLRFKAR